MHPICVSLFSGCGGLDLGLQRAGFRILLGADTDPICAESHTANFPDTAFFSGSVLDLGEETVMELTDGASRPGNIDLIAGGPPCPSFSKSRFYRKEKPRALEDPKGWDGIFGYIKMLEMLRPRAFLLENVPGMSYDVHREALDTLMERAEALGFRCDWRILNAADYGVPQMRQRLFVVGLQDGEFDWPSPTHQDPDQTDLFRQGLLPWVTVGEAIGDLDTEENADDEGHFAGGKHHDLLREVPPGDNYLYFTAKRGHPEPKFEWRSRYWSFLLKLSPDKPSWTIQARRSNNMGPFHWRNRILRVTEVKRLQAFPDDFELSGTIEQQWRQVGNAVPPDLAYHLGSALISALQPEEASV